MVIFIASLLSQYFALTHRVEVIQLETRGLIQEQDQMRRNQEQITDLKLSALSLQIAKLESELNKLKDEK